MNVSQTFYMSLQAQIHPPSNTFDGGGLMLCTGMAMHCDTSLHVGGSQIQCIITSRRMVWLTGGQFLIGGYGCARWCSASGDKHLEFKELGKATVSLSSIEIKNIKVAK